MRLSSEVPVALLCMLCAQCCANDVCKRECSVGVDFGTTGTAYGIMCNDDMEIRHGFLAVDSQKTRTAVLLDAYWKADCNSPARAFGNEAIDQYIANKNAYLFGWGYELFVEFKMGLHRRGRGEAVAVSKDGLECPLQAIIAQALAGVKRSVLEVDVVKQAPARLKWVVTVPAIWRPAAKALMRNACRDGGLCEPKENGVCALDDLMIAYEPEVAALEVAKQATDMKQGLGRREKFMVVDLGGGTVDITVTTVDVSESEQILVTPHTSPKGDALGSTVVDREFETWLREFLGDAAFTTLQKNSQSWMAMRDAWENLKRGHKKGKPGFLRLGDVSGFEPGATLAGKVKAYNTRHPESAEVSCFTYPDCKVIVLPPALIAKFHDEVLRKITDLVKGLAKEHDVKKVFLVGGFATSDLLQDMLKEASNATGVKGGKPEWSCIPLDKPQCAVMRGAVRYARGKAEGHITVAHHYLPESYGTNVCKRCPDDDKECKQRIRQQPELRKKRFQEGTGGILRWYTCNHISVIVEADTRVAHGDIKHVEVGCLGPGPEFASNVYVWDRNTKVSNMSLASQMQRVGNISFPCKHGQRFRLELEFGDEEIAGRVRNLDTDEVRNVTIDYNCTVF